MSPQLNIKRKLNIARFRRLVSIWQLSLILNNFISFFFYEISLMVSCVSKIPKKYTSLKISVNAEHIHVCSSAHF